jgi:thiamine-phosphate pyrophosphorylase
MAIVRGATAGLRAVGMGATVLQLRDPSITVRTLEREAERLVAEAPLPVVVNSRLDVALAAHAAGAHLPEADLPVAAARRLLGDGMLVGRSVHSVAAASEAEAQGADYVVFGPVFGSDSHPGQTPVGLEALRRVARAVAIPVLAIGGVDAVRAAQCIKAGASGFAAIGYFAGDVEGRDRPRPYSVR